MKHLFILFIILTFLVSCSNLKNSSNKNIVLIRTYMQEQENCWNKGDLEGFMQHYWESDSLMFIGKSGVNYSWDATLNNYKKTYTNQEEMGILTFKNLTIQQLSNKYIYVVGKWHLKRSEELKNLEGYYSLIWKKINHKWVIISDHSS
ncbi:MAG: nuclear transport factor 2 family protein [Flavobacteriales bacterium]|nr:nuclear transport factor 2 family protein [Flavobacteriales bacterium]